MTTNQVRIVGLVASAPKQVTSAAGIPHTVLHLEHRSNQTQAGMLRSVFCPIKVVVSGSHLQDACKRISSGSNVKVEGFLAWQQARDGSGKVMLHADSIELIS
ncbi:primosomal replication protein N [Paraferrimonas sedimenticola]|uniref:Replication restart protein PriB n=1 Tax=Paraferrimonas sedimenticola TaxID=375674 RepID=A0AA37W120_9GAMM|nr:primosomal replication protein N [Paraferrimonas sedimenticola]GLP95727.1 hypothetical protein GCM10007895_10330 [Paraferrimonas sedimenticola]